MRVDDEMNRLSSLFRDDRRMVTAVSEALGSRVEAKIGSKTAPKITEILIPSWTPGCSGCSDVVLGSQRLLGSVLEGVWGVWERLEASGSALGPSWAVLRVFWGGAGGLLGGPGSLLEGSRAPVGGSRGPLGGVLGASWGVPGASWRRP